MIRSSRSISFLVESIVDDALINASFEDEALINLSRIHAIEQWRENPSIIERWEEQILGEYRSFFRLCLAAKIEEIWRVTSILTGKRSCFNHRQYYRLEYLLYQIAGEEILYWHLYLNKLKSDPRRPFTKGRTLFPKPPFDFKKIFSQGGVR